MLRKYAQRLRSSWQSGPPPSFRSILRDLGWVFGFQLIYVLLCRLSAPSSMPSIFFREGRPVDWLSSAYLGVGALALASVWSSQRRDGRWGTVLWRLMAVGLAFLALDERLQIHEGLNVLLKADYGEPPAGFRSWDDIIVLSYGIPVLVIGVLALPRLLCRKRALTLFVAGFLMFLTHSTIDAVFATGYTKTIVEETFKLLGSSCVAFGCLSVLRSSEAAEERFTWGRLALPILIAVLGSVMIAFFGESIDRGVRGPWGDPSAWLLSIFLLAGTLLVASRYWGAGTPAEERAPWLGRGFAVLLGLAALAVGSVSWRHLTKYLEPGHPVLEWRQALGPTLPPFHPLLLMLLGGALGLGLVALWNNRAARLFLAAASLCLVAAAALHAAVGEVTWVATALGVLGGGWVFVAGRLVAARSDGFH